MALPRLRAVAAIMAGALLLGATACAGSDGGSQAEADGTITLYSGRNENLIAPLLAQFQAETGIAVQVRYGDTAQMAAQLLEEGDRTPADVFLAQDAGALGAVAKAGMFATLPRDVLDRVNPAFRSGEGTWVGVTGRSRVLVYNSERVDEADLPRSVFELTEAQWRGRVGIAPTNASFQAFITAMRVQHGDDVARAWLAGIAANDPQIRERNGQIVADVNDGRIDVGLVNHYYLYERAREDGVKVDQLAARNYLFPDGDAGALVNVSGVGVLAHAAEDADAQTFVNYLLSAAAQTYFAEQTSEYPMTGAATVPVGLPALSQLRVPDIDLNDLDTLDQTVAMITEAGLA